MVTGGGIEQGETVAETAVREVKEEAGIDVLFVRELGVAESPTGHYVQVTSTKRLPETWEHMDGRAFRWLPVSADLELWGQRGDFVSALVRKRVVGYVTRGRELLVFDHEGMPEVPRRCLPDASTYEGLEEGLCREVEEETGVTEIEIVGILADGNEFEELFGPGAHESHAFHAVAAPAKARTRGSTQYPEPEWTPGSSTSVAGCLSMNLHLFGGMRIPWSKGCECR